MGVDLRCATARGRPYARMLRSDAERLLKECGLTRWELSLVLADDARIRGLNRDFRGRDLATDVLSFPQALGPTSAQDRLPRSPFIVEHLARLIANANRKEPAPLQGRLQPALRADKRVKREARNPLGVSQCCLSGPPYRTARGAPPLLLGDVVMSVETICREARVAGVVPRARLREVLVHGFLHLLGYDHEGSSARARRMFERERELAARLNRVPGASGRRARQRAGGRAKRRPAAARR